MNSQHRYLLCASSIAALFAIALPAAWAQHGDMHAMPGKPPEALGKVNFIVQCDGDAQKEFNHAMALFHSFWFDPAKQSFTEVLRKDPKCGMAYRGIALMSLGNPFAWPANPAAMKAGATAAASAQSVGATTQRERDYIGALQPLFANWETTEHRPALSHLKRPWVKSPQNTLMTMKRKSCMPCYWMPPPSQLTKRTRTS